MAVWLPGTSVAVGNINVSAASHVFTPFCILSFVLWSDGIGVGALCHSNRLSLHQWLSPAKISTVALPSISTRCCTPAIPESEQPYLQDLQVPPEWVKPPVAAQEAAWLRGALHQWLDEEYCPEPANEEISRRCAKVYHYCLMEKQVDIGDILMQMVRELETFSFKESFHGAFTSANAAIDLITKRMWALEGSQKS